MDGLCFAHSEVHAEKRREGQKRGGETTAARLRMLDLDDLPLDSPGDCAESLKRIIHAVASGRMSDAQGRTLASLVKLKLENDDWRKIQEGLDDVD